MVKDEYFIALKGAVDFEACAAELQDSESGDLFDPGTSYSPRNVCICEAKYCSPPLPIYSSCAYERQLRRK